MVKIIEHGLLAVIDEQGATLIHGQHRATDRSDVHVPNPPNQRKF